MASTPLFAAVQDTANAGVQLQSLLESLPIEVYDRRPRETMKRLRQVHDDHDDDGDDADHDYMNVIIHYQTCRGFPHQVMMRVLRCSPPFPKKLCCLLCLLGIVPTRLPAPETESSWTHCKHSQKRCFHVILVSATGRRTDTTRHRARIHKRLSVALEWFFSHLS